MPDVGMQGQRIDAGLGLHEAIEIRMHHELAGLAGIADDALRLGTELRRSRCKKPGVGRGRSRIAHGAAGEERSH